MKYNSDDFNTDLTTEISDVVVVLGGIFLIVLFWGEPDLHQVLIEHFSGCNK